MIFRQSLEPNTEKIFGHVESLPSINDSGSLPYHDTTGAEILFLERIPDGVIPKPKLDPKKPVECCLCGGEIICGFCGPDGCLTQLQEKKKGSLSVASNCSYHYAAMSYKAAAKFSKAV